GESNNEPIPDSSREETRQAMQGALDEVKGQLGRRYAPVIDGRAVEAAAWLDSLNPAHRRQVVGSVGRTTPAQAEQAVAAARAAVPAWRRPEPAEPPGHPF